MRGITGSEAGGCSAVKCCVGGLAGSEVAGCVGRTGSEVAGCIGGRMTTLGRGIGRVAGIASNWAVSRGLLAAGGCRTTGIAGSRGWEG